MTRTETEARPHAPSRHARGRLARFAFAVALAAAGSVRPALAAGEAGQAGQPGPPAAKPAPARPDDQRPSLAFREFDDKGFLAARKGSAPVVLYFEADWCQPCKQMHETTFREPAVLQAAAGMELFRVDMTNSGDRRVDLIRESFQVRGAPTVIVFAPGGKEAARRFGYIPADALAEMLVAGHKPPAGC